MIVLFCGLALAGPEDHRLINPFLAARGYDTSEEATVLLIAADRDAQGGWDAALDHAADGGRAVLVVGPEIADLLPDDVRVTAAQGELLDRHGDALVAPWGGCVVEGGTGAWATDADGNPLATAVSTSWGLTVVVVCIPHLLDDASLLHAGNARLVGDLLVELAPEGGARFVDAGAPSSENAYAALKAAGLLPFMLHLSAGLCVAAWAWGRSFAAPRDPIHTRRRDFAEHLAAVASLYRRVGATQHVAGAFAAWQLARVRARHGAGDEAALAAVIASKHGADPAPIEAALLAARSPVASPSNTAALSQFFEATWNIDPHP